MATEVKLYNFSFLRSIFSFGLAYELSIIWLVKLCLLFLDNLLLFLVSDSVYYLNQERWAGKCITPTFITNQSHHYTTSFKNSKTPINVKCGINILQSEYSWSSYSSENNGLNQIFFVVFRCFTISFYLIFKFPRCILLHFAFLVCHWLAFFKHCRKSLSW